MPQSLENQINAELMQPADPDLLGVASSLGLEVPKEEKVVKFNPVDVQEAQASAAPGIKAPSPSGTDMSGAAKGLAQGAGRAVQNIYNGAIDLINGAARLSSVGFSKLDTQDAINPANKLNVEALKSKPTDTIEQKMGQMLGQYAAPVVATMGVGASEIAATAVSTGIDFMTIDPHQERLSTIINDNYPELRNTAVLGNMISWMGENNPEKESDFEGRFKNALEGAGIGAAVAGMFSGAIKMSRAAKQYISKGKVAAEVTPAVNILDEAALSAAEAKMGSNAVGDQIPVMRPPTPEEARQLSLFEESAKNAPPAELPAIKAQVQKIQEARTELRQAPDFINPNPIVQNVDGGTRINAFSPEWDNLLGFMEKGADNAGPRTWDDVRYAARQMGMDADKSDVLSRILNHKPGNAFLTRADQSFVANELLPFYKQSEEKALEEMISTPFSQDSAEKILAYEAAKLRRANVESIAKAQGSNLGRGLNEQKMLYDMVDAQTVAKFNEANPGAAVTTEAMQATPRAKRPYALQQMLNDKRFKNELFEQMVSKLGGEKNAEQYVNQLRVIKRQIDEMAPGEAEQMKAILDAAQGTSNFGKSMQITNAIMRNSLLSAKTAMGAWLGNAMTMFNTSVEGFGKAAVMLAGEKVPGFGRFASVDKTASKAFTEAYDYSMALFEANVAYMKGMVTGTNPVKVPSIARLEINVKPFKPEYWGLDATSFRGKMLEKTGAVLGMGDYMVGTADQFYGAIMEHAYLKKIAMSEGRTAIENGMNPAELEKFVRNRMRLATVDEVNAAQEFAKENVFAKALDVSTGDAAGVVAAGTNWMKGGPIRQMMFPFVRSKYNMMDYALQHSVFGPLWSSTKVGQALKNGGEEGALAAAKIMYGTSFVGLAGVLAYHGLITGAPPDNPRLKKALEESNKGWQPYSIKVGDTYVGYETLEPMASMLKLGGAAALVTNHLDERDAAATMMLAGSLLVDSFDPQAMGEGFAKAMDFLSEAGRLKDDPSAQSKKFVTDLATRFMPSVVKDAKKQRDEFKRDVYSTDIIQGIKNVYQSQVPWWSEGLEVQRNIWGEPILEKNMLGPDFLLPIPISAGEQGSKVKDVLEKMAKYEVGKPEDERIMKLNMIMPSRVIRTKGMDIPLTNREYEKFVVLASGHFPDDSVTPGKEAPLGTPLKDVISQKAIAIYDMVKGKDIPPALYKSFVSDITSTVTDYRKRAKDLMMQDPEFAEKVRKATLKRMELTNVGF